MKKIPYKGWNRREFLRGTGLSLLGLTALQGWRKRSCTRAEAQTAQRGFVNPRPASWSVQKEEGKVHCQLCPWDCTLKKGERGPCMVRENREGVLYTYAFGNPALIQEDPVERKPFFHVLPGTRALSISTAGCNLHCKFCEVWDMALVAPEQVHAYDIPPEKVIELGVQSNVPSISYAFGEPVIFYEYMQEIAQQAKKAGLLNLIHTSGFIQPEPLTQLLPLMDGANVDLKGFQEQFYQEVVGGDLEVVLNTLKMMKEAGIHLEITHLIIPTLNDDREEMKAMCTWIVEELGPHVPLHFARFYPLYRLSALPRTPVSTLDEAREIAQEVGLNYVYVARVTGHEGENTFCPDCGEIIIRRVGFVIEQIQLEKGHCRYCGLEIPGRWEI